jgi:hypothetical protein
MLYDVCDALPNGDQCRVMDVSETTVSGCSLERFLWFRDLLRAGNHLWG